MKKKKEYLTPEVSTVSMHARTGFLGLNSTDGGSVDPSNPDEKEDGTDAWEGLAKKNTLWDSSWEEQN